MKPDYTNFLKKIVIPKALFLMCNRLYEQNKRSYFIYDASAL